MFAVYFLRSVAASIAHCKQECEDEIRRRSGGGRTDKCFGLSRVSKLKDQDPFCVQV